MPAPQDLEALPYARYLEPLDGEPQREGDYCELHLADTDFKGLDAGNARFTECAVTGVSFEGGSFARARFNDVWVSRTRWVGCGWVEAQLLDVSLLDGVLAGVQAHGSRMRRVVVERCKVDSLNLRGADLRDVEFRDCELLDVDFGGATVASVTFPGSTIRRARFGKATLTKVDFRGARELDVAEGGEALRGAIVDSGQLVELAPMLARTLGILVKDR